MTIIWNISALIKRSYSNFIFIQIKSSYLNTLAYFPRLLPWHFRWKTGLEKKYWPHWEDLRDWKLVLNPMQVRKPQTIADESAAGSRPKLWLDKWARTVDLFSTVIATELRTVVTRNGKLRYDKNPWFSGLHSEEGFPPVSVESRSAIK